MATKKSVTVTLGDADEKKHTVRFNNDEDGAAMSSAYVRKDALKKLGNPDKIKVTIEAA